MTTTNALKSGVYGLAALAILAAAIAGYHVAIVRPALPRLGVVDVAALYHDKETEFTQVIANPQATDADRAKALANAERFARDLQTLIDTLPAQCQCVVLNKAAVMGATDGLMDLTPAARHAVGL